MSESASGGHVRLLVTVVPSPSALTRAYSAMATLKGSFPASKPGGGKAGKGKAAAVATHTAVTDSAEQEHQRVCDELKRFDFDSVRLWPCFAHRLAARSRTTRAARIAICRNWHCASPTLTIQVLCRASTALWPLPRYDTTSTVSVLRWRARALFPPLRQEEWCCFAV